MSDVLHECSIIYNERYCFMPSGVFNSSESLYSANIENRYTEYRMYANIYCLMSMFSDEVSAHANM